MKRLKMMDHSILFLLLVIALLSAYLPSYAGVLVIKYVSLATLFFYLGYYLCVWVGLRRIKSSLLCYICGTISLLIYLFFVILTLDTFLFHAMTWYPGILRYALFDAYGILYVIFTIFGIGFYLGNGKRETV